MSLRRRACLRGYLGKEQPHYVVGNAEGERLRLRWVLNVEGDPVRRNRKRPRPIRGGQGEETFMRGC